MCDCHACTTGRCGCGECDNRPREYTEEEIRAELRRELARDIALERIQIREHRAPSIERQRVRRWGEIEAGRIKRD